MNGYVVQPLLLCILLALGIGLCLYLFVTLKREIAGLMRGRGDLQQRVQTLETALADARLTIQAMGTDVRELEQQTGMLVAPAPPRSGLNLSNRTQVLRMYRHGQDSAGIANSLALPRAEVDLLIKVHQMVLEQT